MSLIRYYALFISADGATTGFRPLGAFPQGQLPALAEGDIVGTTEQQLDRALQLLELRDDPNDYFMLEIEGSREKHMTTGRWNLGHLGLFIGPKGALAAAQKAKRRFTQHWMFKVFRRSEILAAFQKLENPSRLPH